MIDAVDLKNRLGNKKFSEFVCSQQKGETIGQKKKRRRWGANVRFRMCEHGNWIIDNYKPKRCSKCHVYRETKGRDFEPHFNLGLGCYVESKSDMLAAAKSKGMTWIGDDGV